MCRFPGLCSVRDHWKTGWKTQICLHTNIAYQFNASICPTEDEIIFQSWDGDVFKVNTRTNETDLLLKNTTFVSKKWKLKISMTYFVSIVMQDFFVGCNILERAAVVTQLRPLTFCCNSMHWSIRVCMLLHQDTTSLKSVGVQQPVKRLIVKTTAATKNSHSSRILVLPTGDF